MNNIIKIGNKLLRVLRAVMAISTNRFKPMYSRVRLPEYLFCEDELF